MATVSAQDGDDVKIAEPTRERRKQLNDLSVSPLQYPYRPVPSLRVLSEPKAGGESLYLPGIGGASVCVLARVL
jgi:hypothetical protein